MGNIHNHAILATTFSRSEVELIRQWVESLESDHILRAYPKRLFLFGEEDLHNGHTTIVMLPDGSKEGWSASDWFDHLRDQFIDELEASNYEDGSSPWEWVEVGYGDFGQSIVRGNNKEVAI